MKCKKVNAEPKEHIKIYERRKKNCLNNEGSVEMIDEETKNKMLAKLPKVLQDWATEKVFPEPRPRWFRLAKAKHDDVHYLICLIVGKDEKETMKMANELIEWHKKYVIDQKDVMRTEDYTVRKF